MRSFVRSIVLPLASFALGSAIFAFYFLVYRVRLFPMPVGFDTSWYVWRARYVGQFGLGPLDTAVRPGHALLSSVLGSVTGRSQLELASLLPLVLVSAFALAVGALVAVGLGPHRWRWAAAVAVAGTLLGATRLVGENVANLLLLILVSLGLAALARWLDGSPGMVAAVVLFLGAGLAHWTFLPVMGAILALAAVLALPSSRRAAGTGTPPLRTETGALASAIVATGVVMVSVITVVLRAPFSTFEIKEDPRRYLPKLREDLSRLLLPLTAPIAALGAVSLALGPGRPSRPGSRRRSFLLRILVAWTAVCAVGIVYGAATINLPPHRFLMMMVAVPGAVALASAAWWIGGRVRHAVAARWPARRASLAGTAAMAVAVAVLAIPGALAWYRHGPGEWLDQTGLQQTETAALYVASLPPGTPVVLLIGPLGPAGLISVPLKERNLRVGLPVDRQVDVHFFPGEPADLLAGRRTHVSPAIDEEIQPYWDDVRPVLPEQPPVLVLQSFGPDQFRTAQALGAVTLAPGVALLRGPPPPAPLHEAPLPRPVPRTVRGLLLGALLLLLLEAAGLGWAAAAFGPQGSPEVVWSAAPGVGVAAIMLGALVATETGVRLAGPGGIVTYVAVVGGGALAAALTRRRSAARTPTPAGFTDAG